jgi:peptidoglycan/xylan/chitin deacetylase (PgdA/CDA1 family)
MRQRAPRFDRGVVVAVACVWASLAACGGSDDRARDERTPEPAPRVVLNAGERELWSPRPADRPAIPVLLYPRAPPGDFARHMALLAHGGYETITLEQLVRFVKRQEASLPPRPVLLTFDGGRLETWTGADEVLRRHGFNAVLFVDVGRVVEADGPYLTWEELNGMQRSGRWDVQLQSGTGNRLIKYGPQPDDVGPFYAYRGSEEVLGGWRERTFSDISEGEVVLADRVRGYQPLAFAPPFGNYGQAGTNDPHIPRELLARLELSFEVVFTQDREGFAEPGESNPLGRIEVTRQVDAAELHERLATP